MPPVTIREGDTIPAELAKAAGWVRPTTTTKPEPTGPAIAEASASFGAPSERPQGFDALASLAAGQRPKRPVTWFVFPQKLHAEMPDVHPEHRFFAMCQLKAIEEQRAQSNASGSSFMAALTEQVKISVWKIGEADATFDLMEGQQVYGPGGWWEAIGPKGRQLVTRCYADTNGVDDDLGEEILASKKAGWA